MGTVLQDLRYGMRMLARNPAFTAVAVLTLALGIGTNTAIFTLLNSLLLRPLPVHEPEQLAAIQGSEARLSYPDYADFRDRIHSFSGLTAQATNGVSFSAGGPADRVQGATASGNLFSVLGVRPAVGRLIVPEDDRLDGAQPVAVLSYHFWRRRFDADPGIVGSNVAINGLPFTIIGVAEEGFTGTTLGLTIDVWTPLALAEKTWLSIPGLWERRELDWLTVVGRLRLGTTLEQAQAEMEVLAAGLEPDKDGKPRTFSVVSATKPALGTRRKQTIGRVLALLFTAVGFVLLIACANVANLLLARATSRRKEIAIRLALGAGRQRLIRQLLTESLLLALLGGAGGLLLSLWAGELFGLFNLANVSLARLDFQLDYRVFAFAFGLTLITGILFGLLPALQASKANLIPSLKDDSGRFSGGAARSRIRKPLVVTQAALAVVLLIGAGLFLRSLQEAWATNVGFDTENVVSGWLAPYQLRYTEARTKMFYRQLLQRLDARPEVAAATLSLHLPLGPVNFVRDVSLEGPGGEKHRVDCSTIGPGYFDTLGIPLLRGRDFTWQDREEAPAVAIVNQAFVERFWPGQDPVGRQLDVEGRGERPVPVEVIAVAGNIRSRSLRESARPYLYLPLQQVYESAVILVARPAGRVGNFAEILRREVQGLDANLPLDRIYPLRETIEQYNLAQERLGAWLLSLFGLLALAMAAIGLYGVISYGVSQRTHEIGIRMALGAQRRDLLRLVIGQGLMLTLIGIAIGLTAAFALTRFLSSMLFEVSPTDPTTYVAVSLVLTAIALLAAYVPARRATRVDPIVALRYE